MSYAVCEQKVAARSEGGVTTFHDFPLHGVSTVSRLFGAPPSKSAGSSQPLTLRPFHVVRTHAATKTPKSRNLGTSLCTRPWKTHPSEIRVGSGRTPKFMDPFVHEFGAGPLFVLLKVAARFALWFDEEWQPHGSSCLSSLHPRRKETSQDTLSARWPVHPACLSWESSL